MAKHKRKLMSLKTHDVTGDIDRVIEYLTGVKKSLESQDCLNIQFHLDVDTYSDKYVESHEVVAEISFEGESDE